MKAIQIDRPGRVSVVEIPRPRPAAGEVLVEISAAGICGTDVHLYQGRFGSLPQIPGHDLCGVIKEAGAGVSPDLVGRRVTIDPAGSCLNSGRRQARCDLCGRGRTNLCRHGTYLGMSEPGGMQEYLRVFPERTVELPGTVSDETATVLEPVAVALHLVEKIRDRPGPVLVIGGGPIGIVAALLLMLEKRDVTLSEPLAGRRALARQMGVEAVIPASAVHAEMDVSVIVETSGHETATDSMLAAAAPGATIVLVGADTEVPALHILTRELEVRAVKGGKGLYAQAVRLAAEGRLAPGRLISHAFPARDAALAFEQSAKQPNEVTRSVLRMRQW